MNSEIIGPVRVHGYSAGQRYSFSVNSYILYNSVKKQKQYKIGNIILTTIFAEYYVSICTDAVLHTKLKTKVFEVVLNDIS